MFLLWHTGFALAAASHSLVCSAGASYCRGFFCLRAQDLEHAGSVAVVHRHVGSSGTRDRTRVHRVGRQILNHCTTREGGALYAHFTDEEAAAQIRWFPHGGRAGKYQLGFTS